MKKLVLTVILAVAPAMAADLYTFNVQPAGGNIQGNAGTTIGWGYSIQNQSSSLWLSTTGLNADTFQNGTPNLIFDFPDVAPGATVSVPFDASTAAGLFELTWNSTALLGFTNVGTFNLSADWYSGDPLSGGTLVAAALTESQPYSATVTPEPATIGMVGFMLVSVVWVKLFKVERSR